MPVREEIERYASMRLGMDSEGMTHTRRVYNLARRLSSDGDDEVLFAACFLHDINMDKPHPRKAAEEADAFLKKIGFSDDKRKAVFHAISEHGYYGNPDTKEAFMLFDADQLDAMGCSGFGQFAGITDDPARMEEMLTRIEGECVSVLKLSKSKELAKKKIAHREEIIRMMREEVGE